MQTRKWIGWLFIVLLSVSCTKTVVFTRVVAFSVDKEANSNHPIAMDLVIVYTDVLVKELLKLPAREWFTKRAQLKRDFPSTLFTWEWEVVPGQTIPIFKIPTDAKNAKGILIFADYVIPGLHRARIDPFEGVLVRLLEKEFVVQPIATE